MAFLTCIGAHGENRKNLCGYGSRGYWLFRQGTTVYCHWGAVVTIRTRTYRVQWYAKPQSKRYPFGTEEKARAFMAEKIRQLMRPNRGYSRLPKGMRILPASALND